MNMKKRIIIIILSGIGACLFACALLFSMKYTKPPVGVSFPEMWRLSYWLWGSIGFVAGCVIGIFIKPK